MLENSNDTEIFRPHRDIPEDVLNTYCWIHSTYTVADAFTKKQGSEVPFPGVDNSQSRVNVTIKHTKYYQWVAFTLFFQVSVPHNHLKTNAHEAIGAETERRRNGDNNKNSIDFQSRQRGTTTIIRF